MRTWLIRGLCLALLHAVLETGRSYIAAHQPASSPSLWMSITLAVLSQLVRRLRDDPVTFVATMRAHPPDVGPDLAATVLTVETDVYDDDKRELMWDIATLINAELRELAAAGCKVIQIEEPAIHSTAAYTQDKDVLVYERADRRRVSLASLRFLAAPRPLVGIVRSWRSAPGRSGHGLACRLGLYVLQTRGRRSVRTWRSWPSRM